MLNLLFEFVLSLCMQSLFIINTAVVKMMLSSNAVIEISFFKIIKVVNSSINLCMSS